MALKITWTTEAEESYDRIIEYLERNWTEREIRNFVQATQNILGQIVTRPKIYKASKKKNIHIGFIMKHVSLYYHVKPDKKEITLLYFWDNRQDPANQKI